MKLVKRNTCLVVDHCRVAQPFSMKSKEALGFRHQSVTISPGSVYKFRLHITAKEIWLRIWVKYLYGIKNQKVPILGTSVFAQGVPKKLAKIQKWSKIPFCKKTVKSQCPFIIQAWWTRWCYSKIDIFVRYCAIGFLKWLFWRIYGFFIFWVFFLRF